MREIKFRGMDIEGTWHYGNLTVLNENVRHLKQGHYISNGVGLPFAYQVRPETVGQFTGLEDRNGNLIYEGDVIRVRRPGRDQQTHYGDNIPLGQYTEPLEPTIQEYQTTVKFEAGVFGCEVEDQDHLPLSWILIDTTAKDENQLKEMFSGGWGERIFEGWEDDKEYLFEEYKVSSVEELMNYIGVEVIGNIHDQKAGES